MAIGAKLRYEVLQRDQYACRFCGSSAPDVVLHIDHVVPKSAGGLDIASNLQVLCEECNLGKSMAMPERWLVSDVRNRETRWRRDPYEEMPDDLSEMFAFLDARFALAETPADDLIGAILHVMADVYPYRPDGSELIQAVARHLADAGQITIGAPA